MKELFESLKACEDLYELQHWAKSVELKELLFVQREFYKKPKSEDDMYRKLIHDLCSMYLEYLERIADDKLHKYLVEVIENLEKIKKQSSYIALEKTQLFQYLDRAQYNEVSFMIKHYLDAGTVMQNRLNQFYEYLEAKIKRFNIGLYVCEHFKHAPKESEVLYSHCGKLLELLHLLPHEEVNTSPMSNRVLAAVICKPKITFGTQVMAYIFNDVWISHRMLDKPRPDISEMGSEYEYLKCKNEKGVLITGDTTLYERKDKQYWVNKLRDQERERIQIAYFN